MNVFDQFDPPPAANPFDQFDAAPTQPTAVAPQHPTTGPTGSLIADIPTRLGSGLTDFLAQSAALPRALAQGVDWVGNKAGVNVGADQAFASVAPLGVQMFPDYPAAKERAYGLTGATEYVPETFGGRMVQAGIAMAPAGLAGGIRQVIPTIAGAMTGEGAAEMLPEHPIIARGLGFALGNHAATSVANTTAKTVGMLTGTAPTTELYQAYKRQDVPTDLAGNVSQNRALQGTQALASRFPGGADVIAEKAAEAGNAWQDAVERHAAALGPSATTQEAGTALQGAAGKWLRDWKQTSDANWQSFRKEVPATTPIPISNFAKALQDVNQDFGGADALADVLKPTLGANLQQALSKDVSGYGTLPWQAIQATRTRLGEMLESGQPVADTSQSSIKRLYGALSDDMRDGANAAGPKASRAFNQANAYTAFGHNLIEDHVGPILKATNPEEVAQYALAQARKGGTRLAALNSPFALNGQVNDLGAALLRQAADSPQGASALPRQIAALSPEARNELFGPAAAGVKDVNDIARSFGSSVRLMGNPSGTAATEASGMGRLMTAIEMGRTGHELGGGWGRAAGMATGLMAPSFVGKAASLIGANPLLARLYSTDLAPFTAPGMYSPNALYQLTAPDRRTSAGVVPANPLLFAPGVVGNDPRAARR